MSGIVQNNILRSSGTVAVSAAGLNWVDTIITGSTATVEAGNGYWVNTTSNTCTITLPSSAEKGDQIVIIDYARTWGTNKIIIDSNGLNYQGNPDTYTVEYTTDGQSVNIVYSDATKGWIPLEDDVTALEPLAPPTQLGLFAFGRTTGDVNMSNKMNSSGVIASDTTGVGTARYQLSATTYGGDKAVYAFGIDNSGNKNMSNKVSNQGVVATDTTGVGTARGELAAAGYGGDKGIFGFGAAGPLGITNLASNQGVIGSDVSKVSGVTARQGVAATAYGGLSAGTAVFAYGGLADNLNMSNKVSNTGVMAADTTGVGSFRWYLSGVGYGGDKGIFAWGASNDPPSYLTRNLVSNTGVIGSDVSTTSGTARHVSSAATYGGDKAAFCYATMNNPTRNLNTINLVSNTGVIAADSSGAGTARSRAAGVGYSYST